MYVQEEARNTVTDDQQLRESDTVGNAEPDGATLHPLPSQISTGEHCEVAQGEEIDTKPKLCPEVKSLLEKEEENRKANKPLRSLELRKIVSDALSLQQKFEGVYQVSSCNSNDGHYGHPYPPQALRPIHIYKSIHSLCTALLIYNCHPNKLIKSVVSLAASSLVLWGSSLSYPYSLPEIQLSVTGFGKRCGLRK